MSSRFAVIMAGGSGTRFWPRSRAVKPKQLLEARPGKSLIEETMARVPEWIPAENVLIVTNAEQAPALKELVSVPDGNVLCEPVGRDTAPCVALAAAVVQKRAPGGSMVVMAADHIIEDVESFQSDLEVAFRAAETEGSLVTFGVEPEYAATGYGYIEFGEEQNGVRRVAAFEEKPNAERAEEFKSSGRHLWNSGIFVWTTTAILDEINGHLPDLGAAMSDLESAIDGPDFQPRLEETFPKLAKVSIDVGVMQKAAKVQVVPASFDWDDVGSFESLARFGDKDAADNVCFGEVCALDAGGNIVDNRSEGMVALLGVKDLVVVRTKDAILVAHRKDEQRVKEMVEKIRSEGGEKYL